jgi:hypothetical protein
LNGDLYLYDISPKTGARKPAEAVRRLTSTGGYETDARFSPRSHYVSFVRDQNLYVIDLANDTERAVTREGGGLVSYGTAEFIAQEEMGRATGGRPSLFRAACRRAPVAEVETFEIRRQARASSAALPGGAAMRVELFCGSRPRRVPLDLGGTTSITARRLVCRQPRAAVQR